MKDTTKVTAVVFRAYKGKDGQPIALFPYEMEGNRVAEFCSSFMHVGQHGAAQYEGVMRDTRPATAEEAAALHNELTAQPYGYVLYPIKRRNFTRFMQARKAFKQTLSR